MQSFHDIYDFDYAGRTSTHFDGSMDAAAPSASLLFPIELECSPIPSLSPTIDPSLLRLSAPLDEALHLSAFLPVARMPLILADAGRHSGGSSDFQTNTPLPLNSLGLNPDNNTRKPNGLGLSVVNEDVNGSEATAERQLSTRSRTSSLDGLFGDLSDLSSDCYVLHRTFHELENSSVTNDTLIQGISLFDQEPITITSTENQTSRISFSNSYHLGDTSISYGPSLLSLQQGYTLSNSSNDLPGFTGLVADINMFDKESKSNTCIRPRDIMGESPTQASREPSSPQSVKIEDTLDDTVLISSNPTTPKYLKVPQSNWPQIPTEHLPFIIEQYLAAFTPNEDSGSGVQGCQLEAVSDCQSSEVPGHPYTPITEQILEAVEEPQQAHFIPAKHRRRLADKTNTPRTTTASRTGVNIMDMYENLVPQDVILEKAHEGVPIVAVVQKTRYFFMTHPGERLSEELLFSFAGRLNASGQQMPGYRCYVQGCSKTTKRKDHMADHVRTHLGEKPFQCSVCGMGFIRNNDCQRHENNHRPDKKFVCVCKAAFSRRDLFVRHQKTVCTLSQGVVLAGCFRRPRRSSKASSAPIGALRKDTADGDDANDLDYIPSGIS